MLLIITGNLGLNAQDYFKEAEKLINANKQLPKALVLLDSAAMQDFGSCGLSWADAFWSINYLKARVYYQQENYTLALSRLDSITDCDLGGDCMLSDYLKFECLAEIYGKDRLKKIILSESDTMIYVSAFDLYNSACIKVDSINYNFCFFINNDIIEHDVEEMNLKNLIVQMGFYSILDDETPKTLDPIKDIRKKFSTINESLDKYDRIETNDINVYKDINPEKYSYESVGIYGLAMVNLERYYDEDKLRKAIVTFDAEGSDMISEYYFWDDVIFFVFQTKINYKSAKWAVDFDPNKKKVWENRYYIENGKLIKWINSDKNIVDLSKINNEVESQVISDADLYMNYKE